MNAYDEISGFLGALANLVNKSNVGQGDTEKLQKDDLLEILKRTKIETWAGDVYTRPHILIKKAVDYWTQKNRPDVVENIKTVLIT